MSSAGKGFAMPWLDARGGAPHRTKQAFVYRTLHDAISTCEIRPGERLIIDDLARRLQVSAIPVREALQVLQSEGLVITVPHVGATVAPISRDSIVDVFTVLEGLESVACRYAAERATPKDVDGLRGLVERMDQVVGAGNFEGWPELNAEFHLRMSAMTGLALLQEMTARVLDRWNRVRRFFFTDVLLPRVVKAQEEHRLMIDAFRDRDVERLVGLVRQHNQSALVAYVNHLGEAEPKGQRLKAKG
jgi:DNA-binding GntR family transcriptional regulator